MSWIVIPNWQRFQHYTDRTPPWIKLYTELNSEDEWLRLSYAQRGLLVTLWIEYGRARGVIRVSDVPQIGRQKTRREHLQALSDAGFIQIVASKPLAYARAGARSGEKRREEKPSKEGFSSKSASAAAASEDAAAPARKKKMHAWVERYGFEFAGNPWDFSGEFGNAGFPGEWLDEAYEYARALAQPSDDL